MSRVRNKDTRAEILVRSIVHRLGYRFRKNRTDLPGRPDIVLPRHRKIIFVHGCFWHSHPDCPRARRPTGNASFWQEKLDANVERDRKNIENLNAMGWHTLIVWQCQLRRPEQLIQTLSDFLKKS
jgi:DNA mismatch endonuclease (patch repair protein)